MSPITAVEVDSLLVQFIEANRDAQVSSALQKINAVLDRENNEALRSQAFNFLQTSLNSILGRAFREGVLKAKNSGLSSPEQIANYVSEFLIKEIEATLARTFYKDANDKMRNELAAFFNAAVIAVAKYPNPISDYLAENMNPRQAEQFKEKLVERWQAPAIQARLATSSPELKEAAPTPTRAARVAVSAPVEFTPSTGRYSVSSFSLPARTHAEIKTALQDMSTNPAVHSVSIGKRTKTWSVTLENKSDGEKRVAITCKDDKILQARDLNPNNALQIDAYVKAIKAMAVGKVDVTKLVIQVDQLPLELAIAIAKAAENNNMKTSKTLAELGPAPPDSGCNYSLAVNHDKSIGVRPRPREKHHAPEPVPSQHRARIK